jgi:hypothetical protein
MELVTFSSYKACIEKIISTRVYPFNLEFLRFVDPIGLCCTRIKFGQIEKKGFILHELVSFFMTSKAILIVFSAMVLSSLLTLGQVLVDSSFAQENMTGATNDTGAMMGGNQTNQTGEGNQTQQGPLEQLGEALGGMFGGGGNQSQ